MPAGPASLSREETGNGWIKGEKRTHGTKGMSRGLLTEGSIGKKVTPAVPSGVSVWGIEQMG